MSEDRLAEGMSALHAGEFDRAGEVFEALIAQDPGNAKALIGHATVHQMNGSWPEVKACAEMARQAINEPGELWAMGAAWRLRMDAALGRGQWEAEKSLPEFDDASFGNDKCLLKFLKLRRYRKLAMSRLGLWVDGERTDVSDESIPADGISAIEVGKLQALVDEWTKIEPEDAEWCTAEYAMRLLGMVCPNDSRRGLVAALVVWLDEEMAYHCGELLPDGIDPFLDAVCSALGLEKTAAQQHFWEYISGSGSASNEEFWAFLNDCNSFMKSAWQLAAALGLAPDRELDCLVVQPDGIDDPAYGDLTAGVEGDPVQVHFAMEARPDGDTEASIDFHGPLVEAIEKHTELATLLMLSPGQSANCLEIDPYPAALERVGDIIKPLINAYKSGGAAAVQELLGRDH